MTAEQRSAAKGFEIVAMIHGFRSLTNEQATLVFKLREERSARGRVVLAQYDARNGRAPR